MKDIKTDFEIEWKILNKTRSKFNTKHGCKLCSLKNIEIDKNITQNKKSKTYVSTTKNTFIEKLYPTKFQIKVKPSHEHNY